MRYLLATATTISTGFAGGMVGWRTGVGMDRFRWLGLGPEEFWHTDPENVWAWGFVVGVLIGAAVGLTMSASAFRGDILTFKRTKRDDAP